MFCIGRLENNMDWLRTPCPVNSNKQSNNRLDLRVNLLKTLFVTRPVMFSISQKNPLTFCNSHSHYSHLMMGAIAYRIASLTIVYSIVYSGGDQRKHQSSVSLAFVRGIHRWPVNSTQKWPVTRKKFPFDDIIMLFNRGSLQPGHCDACQILRDIQPEVWLYWTNEKIRGGGN